MPKLQPDGFVRTTIRIPKQVLEDFDSVISRQGINRGNALAILMTRYVNEQTVAQKTLENLSDPDILVKVLNGLDKDKLELLKNISVLNKD